MTQKVQSHQFPEYLSQYYKEKTSNQTLQIIGQGSNQSIFHKRVFSICDIIGNFENGFILIHYDGYLYLVDQHAASEKSLFLQYMLNPTQKYTSKVNYHTYIPNYYRETLQEKKKMISEEGWVYQQVKKKAVETQIRIIQAPLMYGKQLKEEDFIFLLEKLYNDKEIDENSYSTYSNNQRNYMASYACHNALKVGDKLRIFEMRGLLDSLYKMDSPFNCPHGRPIIVSLGRSLQRKTKINFQKKYEL